MYPYVIKTGLDLFVRSFVHVNPFSRSFVRSFVNLFVRLFVQSLHGWLIRSFIHLSVDFVRA